MILKLAKKKEINEDVLRMIIQYGLGFASRVKNLENKEIEDWKEDKLYEKGAKVLYNNYLWIAKVTNQSSTWNESYWEKVGDDLELIDLDTIKTMLGLTTDELQTLSSIILDSQVRLDKTWSSSKIYTDLQQCLSDSKAFTLSKLATTMTASFEIATSTADMTEGNILYLLSTGANTYDIYALINGTPTVIASTTIDLSQYAKLSDLNNYYDKATSDGKYATITTVDGKVDKTSILSTISSTPNNDKLLSEKAISDTFVKKTDLTTHASDTNIHITSAERTAWNKKANATDLTTHTSNKDIHVTTSDKTKWNKVDNKVDKTDIVDNLTSTDTDKPLSANQGKVLKGEVDLKANKTEVVKKTDITTTINSASTDKQIPSAKAVYDNIQNIKLPMIKYDTTKDLLEQIKTTFDGKDRSFSFKILNATIDTNSVPENGNFQGIVYGEYGRYFTIMMTCVDYSVMYTGIVFDGNFLGWRKVCTTSVKDMSPSEISSFVDTDVSGVINYRVKNGICFVKIWGVQSKTAGKSKFLLNDSSMPIPNCFDTGNALFEANGDGTTNAFACVDNKGALIVQFYKANSLAYCSFSYPVSES